MRLRMQERMYEQYYSGRRPDPHQQQRTAITAAARHMRHMEIVALDAVMRDARQYRVGGCGVMCKQNWCTVWEWMVG